MMAGNALSALTIIAVFLGGSSALTVTTGCAQFAGTGQRTARSRSSSTLSYVWPRTQTPIYVIMVVFAFNAILMLPPLASTSALSAIAEFVSVLCLQVSSS